MAKKIDIAPKPSKTASRTASADAWVGNRQPPDTAQPAMKRLTIDVSQALHSRIKVQCAMSGKKMADVIRELLEERFPDSP